MDLNGGDDLAADLNRLRFQDEDGLQDPSSPVQRRFRHVVKNHHKVTDITRKFTEACKSLKTGELIKDDNFSLFESVQALEIMDPKMDNGYLKPGETLYDYYDVTAELSPEEVVGIMDQLLCYEMSWHQGYPLAQNLFTSQHIDNLLSQQRIDHSIPYFVDLERRGSNGPGPLIQLVLRSFCLAIIKSCQQVNDILWSQQYYEDEDFSTFTFGRDLLSDVSDSDCIDLLREASQWLQSDNTDISEELVEALACRIIHRRSSLCFYNLCKEERMDWKFLKAALVLVRETHPRGKQAKGAFNAKLQRKLANTTAPRPIVDIDFQTACKQAIHIYEDLEAAANVLELYANANPRRVLAFLWQYSARDPPPSAFPRAMLQAFLFEENGPLSVDNIANFLVEELRFVLPDEVLDVSHWAVEVPSSHRFIIAKHIDFFLDQAASVWINFYRSMCQNHSRMRRCLSNVLSDLIELKGILESKGGPVDENCFESEEGSLNFIFLLIEWTVRDLRYKTMLWILFSGFQQELYQPGELLSIYSIGSLADMFGERYSSLKIIYVSYFAERTTLTKLYKCFIEVGEPNWTVTRALQTKPGSSWTKVRLLEMDAGFMSVDVCLCSVITLIYVILSSLSVDLAPRAGAFGEQKLQLELRLKPLHLAGDDVNDVDFADRALEVALVDNVASLKKQILELTGNSEAIELETKNKSSVGDTESALQVPRVISDCLMLIKHIKSCIKRNADIVFGDEPADDEALSERRACEKVLGFTRDDLWWRNNFRATLRTTVKAGMFISELEKQFHAGSGDLHQVALRIQKIKIPPHEKRDHPWWVLPDIEWAAKS